MKNIIITLCITLLISGCAAVKEHKDITQKIDTPILAGIGDLIIQVNKEKNLPNAFGKSDIFGRTTPTGKIFVYYQGTEGNNAVFIRKSISIETGATTMNSTPLVFNTSDTSSHSGTINGQYYSGNSTTTKTNIIPAAGSTTQTMDNSAFKITVNLKDKEKFLLVEGYKIEIIKASKSSIEYVISYLDQ